MGTSWESPRNAKAPESGASGNRECGNLFPELKATREKIDPKDPIPIFREPIYRLTVNVGGEENTKTLRHTYANRSSALWAARAGRKKVQRGSATLSFTLARGQPELSPEWRYRVEGIKADIGAVVWLGERATHQLRDAGLTTALEMERRQQSEPNRPGQS
ncbi:hypothetical protein ACFPU0_03585 [Pseudomonas sp. GCM10022186]|uniref:hypothetical protein n=1 Tax=Pseudomonas sp. GCM10022186 TaxID=3252650 RepID=UPI00361DD1CA